MNALLILASEGGANPVSFQTLPAATAFVVFGVVFIALAYFVWPTVAKGLDDRNAKIVGEIKGAEEARAAAKAAQAEFESRRVPMRSALLMNSRRRTSKSSPSAWPAPTQISKLLARLLLLICKRSPRCLPPKLPARSCAVR